MRTISWVCALILAAAIAARYPPIAVHLSNLVHALVDAAAGFALFVAVAAEARMKRGEVGPLWMRVPVPPRMAMALAMSFITTVIAQTLQWSLGPVDPSFADGKAPVSILVMWYFIFTIGFVGVGMMSAPSSLLPVLHPPARLLTKLPAAVALPLYGAVGAAVGIAFGLVVVNSHVAHYVEIARDFTDKYSLQITIGFLVITVGPVILFPNRATDD
jgi:hypothetical protein